MDSTAVASQSLRQRQRGTTRALIRRAALTLVAERGWEATTVEDIAAAAGVSARTFFNHFPTKEDAISGLEPGLRDELLDQLAVRPAGETAPEAVQAALLEVMARRDIDHQELLERFRATRSDPHLMAYQVSRWGDLERQVGLVLAARRGTDACHDHYASLVVATSLAATRVALMSWCAKGGRVPLGVEMAAQFDVLRSGLVEP